MKRRPATLFTYWCWSTDLTPPEEIHLARVTKPVGWIIAIILWTAYAYLGWITLLVVALIVTWAHWMAVQGMNQRDLERYRNTKP